MNNTLKIILISAATAFVATGIGMGIRHLALRSKIIDRTSDAEGKRKKRRKRFVI